MILGTFFNLAFSNLSSEENFKAINIAILDNEKFQDDENFKKFINNLSQNNDNKIFNIEYTDSVEDAESMIDQNETIWLHRIIDNKANYTSKRMDLNKQLQSIIDDYYQSVSMINNIANFNYELIKDNIIIKLILIVIILKMMIVTI
jgi:ABC-2 type transport system permease protein